MEVQKFYYDNKIVKQFAYATIIWGIVALVVGVLIALQLAAPIHNFNIQFITFGRARPIHTNAVIFAFVGNAFFLGAYYSLQRLLKARMFSDLLSKLHFWGWQLIIVLAAVTLALGYTTSKEYAELEWPIDILITIVWVIFAWNMFGTIAKRRVKHLYVAIWFYIASVLAIAILHIVNSLELPAGLLKSYSVFGGVQDALVQWWYGHNAVGFFLTTPFLGLMYYFLPKAANRPIYSYRLSIIHFWALVFIYIWTGPHHLLYQALPDWVQSLGVVFSIMLIAPSWGGMVNGLLTLRGAWDKVRKSAVLKFFVVAITAYGMSTFEGPMLAIKFINKFSHFTDWTVAHAHVGGLGWNGFMAFGVLYWLVPKLFKTKLFSEKLANTHFWIGTFAILLWVVPMYWAAFVQALRWSEYDADGFLKYQLFIETSKVIIPMYITRAVGGALYLLGAVIMVFNLVKTIKSGSFESNEAAEAAPLQKINPKRNPVAETVHKWLERRPVQLSIVMFIALIIGGAVEMIPMQIIESNVPTIKTVKPYTPLELEGRDIYIKEGCYNCHSQVVRPLRAETDRYGEYSKPGEFVYDHPFQWGSKRTGPDLARSGVVGSKTFKSAVWHFEHFMDPQTQEGSVMPPYPWLVKKDVNLKKLPKKIKVMRKLGVPYEEGYEDIAVQDYMKQAQKIADELKASKIEIEPTKEMIALIAYLHRLGRDITLLDKLKKETEMVVEVPDILTDEASITEGKAIFLKNCANCHGNMGEGMTVGPNLTDNYYLLGGTNEDIYKAIYLGNPPKGMQAWKDLLKPIQMQQVWSFVLSIEGSNPPNAKEPQGEKLDKEKLKN